MDDIKEKFKEFHLKNPKVYKRLVELTKQAHEKGKTRVGMKMLFEVVRWNEFLDTSDSDFKLNNNYTSYYARMIMHQHPEFGEIFETRSLTSDRVSKMFPNVKMGELPNGAEAIVHQDSIDVREVKEVGTGRKAVVILS